MKGLANEPDIVTLRLREATTIPIEADSICPDLFVSRTLAEIKTLPAFYGSRKVTLGDLFEIEGDRSDIVVVEGDLGHVKKIGLRMNHGRVLVRGNVGLHLGAYMRGGEIIVEGNASDWAGAQIQGGVIRIKGNAGHRVGAAYPGEKRGANRGTIIVEGNAGREVGARARRVLIVVQGDVGEFAGAYMIAGSIIVLGRLGKRAGAGNKRGTIVALGETPEILLTYRYECTMRPVFLRCYLRRLLDWGLPVPKAALDGDFRRYSGDVTSLGKGEILVYAKFE
jgi:formylmethanofuran dehydrogenase subunit C